MSDFRFQNSAYLLLLLALPLVQLVVTYFHRNARDRLLRFVAAANLNSLLKEKGLGGSGRKKLLFWAGLFFLILALARPQANPIVEEMEGASLDIYVLLDVSRSMDAEDVPPSRLAKAKRSIGSLMQLLSGDRVGVIAFAGTAVMISPLTADYEVIRTFLQNVDTSLIQNQGTDITNALSMAEEAMERGAERTGDTAVRSNVFLVMSDGEDHASEDWGVVDRIHEEGGTIFTIAFGTANGASIPVRSARGELSGYKRDRQGNQVKTAVQTKSLEEIARRGGGQFYFSTLDEGEIRDILNRMQGMDRSGAALMRAKVYQEYFVPVLAAAVICLLFSFFSIRSLFSGLLKRKAWLFLLLPLSAHADPRSLLWDSQKRAFEASQELAGEGKAEEAANRLKTLLADSPDSPELNYDLGTYLIEAKKGEEGRQQLQRLIDQPNPLRERALFNVAGSYAQEGKKDEARAAYAEAIRSLQTKNRDAQDNTLLEMAKQNLARLATDPPPPQGGQGGSQDKNQNQDQKDQDQKNQDSKNQDQQGDQKKDEKNPKDGDSGKDQKDQKNQKDQDKQGSESQDKKDQDKGDEKKDEKDANQGEEEKKDQQESGEGQQKNNPPPRGMRTGKKEFKEKGDMAEDDAKRILEALKQRETGLQKKMMRQKSKGDYSDNESDKDW
jgi:Ca-activated chloride channel family protein